jgi:thiamine transport system permease protein
VILKPNAGRMRDSARHLLWLIPLLFLIIFFFIPLGKVLFVMVSREGIISIPSILKPLGFTIWQAVLSTLLTFIVGLPAAYLFSHFRFIGKRSLRLLVTLPFILPTVVVAAGFNSLLGPNGWLNLLLMNRFGFTSPPIAILNTLGVILFAHVFYNTSILIRVVGGAWSELDVDMPEAGAVLGATPFQVFLKVTLPLLKPSLLAAGLLVFLFDFTSFGVILLLGGPAFSTLETEIYTQTLSMLNLRMAGILSLVQLTCTLLVTVLYTRVNAKRTTSLKPGKGIEPQKTVGLFQFVFVGLSILFLILLFISPILSLVIRSFISFDAASGISRLTAANYLGLFTNARQSYFYVPPVRAALNSLGFALFTAALALLLGVATAYAQKGIPRIKKWIDSVIMLPLGTSAVTMGLGFLITFNKPPFDVASFPVLIPIAHTLIAFPFVLRSVAPVLGSIPHNLMDAGSVLGASPWKVWWQVEAPIVSRAALVGGLYAFAISLGEFGATTFLARPELPTLPVAIYRFLSQPGETNYGQALAMATLLLVLCSLAMALIERIPLPGSREY